MQSKKAKRESYSLDKSKTNSFVFWAAGIDHASLSFFLFFRCRYRPSGT